jgi:tRNA G46 methylase TrmB
MNINNEKRNNPKYILIGEKVTALYGQAWDDPYWSGLQNNPENEFYEIIQTLLPIDGVALDIGANIGIKTIAMSRIAARGRVLSIEPGDKIAQVLAMNIKANNLSNVVIDNSALSDNTCEVYFSQYSAWGHIAVENWGGGDNTYTFFCMS